MSDSNALARRRLARCSLAAIRNRWTPQLSQLPIQLPDGEMKATRRTTIDHLRMLFEFHYVVRSRMDKPSASKGFIRFSMAWLIMTHNTAEAKVRQNKLRLKALYVVSQLRSIPISDRYRVILVD